MLLKKWVWVLMPVSFELVDPISGHGRHSSRITPIPGPAQIARKKESHALIHGKVPQL